MIDTGFAEEMASTERREVVASVATEALVRVMHVTWSLVAGGSENYAFNLARNLDPARFRSLFCAVDQGGALEPEIREAGFPCFVMHRRNGIDLRLVWRMYRLFKTNRVDVVHTHHFNQLFYGVLGARLAGARVIHTEHSVEYLERRRLRVALRLLSALCDRVVAIGEDGRRVLLNRVRIPLRKLRVVSAGVSASDENRSEARRALGLNEGDRVAVIVARLFPEKNHRLLLDAFAEVVKRVARARLLIVGEGMERDAIEQQIGRLDLSSSVRLLGVRRDVPCILAASDVFVLSSDREGLPLAVLEAMAAGRPVIATRVGDLPLVVRDGETGRLVTPAKVDELAEALVEVLEHPKVATEMGGRGRAVARDSYSLESMIRAFETLYASGA